MDTRTVAGVPEDKPLYRPHVNGRRYRTKRVIFQWKARPEGRVALCAILRVAYDLGYTDTDMMEGRFPGTPSLVNVMSRVTPWLPNRMGRPWSEIEVQSRLRHMFQKPGARGIGPTSGISSEHPTSINARAELRAVYLRHGADIAARVHERLPITLNEAMMWGKG